ncbi:MAG: DUF4397 domain-containing protein [Actinomycetes bacterium]
MTVRSFRALALVAAGALVACIPALAVAPAAAAAPGYVRLAHLSPDTPAVDVWVTSFRGGSYSKVLPGVTYGAVSDYERLRPGVYTIAMRPPGAPEDSEPLLRTNVTVERGGAYTVAGIGRNADISLRVLTDDLSRPSRGTARMRVVQASSVAPIVDVTTTTGTTIADDAAFPSTTEYAEVGAQQWTLRVTPQDSPAPPVEESVQVESGAIYTALVLDRGDAEIQLVVRADAAASATRPRGSVATGLGGGVEEPQSSPWLVAAGLVGLVVGLLGLIGLSGRVVLASHRAGRARG